MSWSVSARTCRTTWPAAIVVHCPKPVTLFAADSRPQLVRFLLGASRHAHLQHQRGGRLRPQRPRPRRPRSGAGLAAGAAARRGSDPATGPRCHLGGGAAATRQPRPHPPRQCRTRPTRRSSTPATSPPSPTCTVSLPACASPSGSATPLRCAPTSAPPMAPWPGTVDDATLATVHPGTRQTAFHPVGTCRMGTDDAAVVDSRATGPRPGRATRRRRLDHAPDHPRPHPRPHRHDRRTRRRPHPSQQPLSGTTLTRQTRCRSPQTLRTGLRSRAASSHGGQPTSIPPMGGEDRDRRCIEWSKR